MTACTTPYSEVFAADRAWLIGVPLAKSSTLYSRLFHSTPVRARVLPVAATNPGALPAAQLLHRQRGVSSPGNRIAYIWRATASRDRWFETFAACASSRLDDRARDRPWA